MRLKVFTTAFILCTIILFGLVALMLATPPKGQSHAAKRQYVIRTAELTAGLVVALGGSMFCSLLYLRRERERLRVEALENMRELLEASLESHRKKGEEPYE